jgi:peptidoglycan/xylan/chitin deacetylase (PgdA/CDA1 family)
MSPLGTRGGLVGAAALAAAAAAHAAPAVAAWSLPRRLFLPGLAGVGRPDHVALTFDDGPDPRSTPLMLEVLALRGVRATFFLVGRNVAANPGLAAEIAAAGHELAVHGLRHRLLLRYPPRRVHRDLAYARALVTSAAGTPPRWFRPPFGVLSTGAAVAARRLRMRTVLWSAWGRDWTANATGESVLSCVARDLTGGGTVLLHDTASDTAAPGSWRATVDAVPRLLDLCAVRGWAVGPLAEHGLPAPEPAGPVPAR